MTKISLRQEIHDVALAPGEEREFSNGRKLSFTEGFGAQNLTLTDPTTDTYAHLKTVQGNDGVNRVGLTICFFPWNPGETGGRYKHAIEFEQTLGAAGIYPKMLSLTDFTYNSDVHYRFSKEWREAPLGVYEQLASPFPVDVPKAFEFARAFVPRAYVAMLQGELPDFSILNLPFGADFLAGETLLEMATGPDGTPRLVIDRRAMDDKDFSSPAPTC